MRPFQARRLKGAAALAVGSAALVGVVFALWVTLHRHALYSGWALFAMVVFLAAFNIRKKMPFLPLGSASLWLQVHIYVGLLSIVGFFVHIFPRAPNGVFESLLGAVFLLVAFSGVAGLIISRAFATRLSSRSGETPWERIPRMRGLLNRDAERVALACQAETGSTAITSLYVEELRGFFAGPRNAVSHLLGSSRPVKDLLDELDAQRRYVSDSEKQYIDQLSGLVQAKDDLDYHTALQSALKYWLFLHIPMTYVLLIFAVTHALLVYTH